jgi:transcriptional regulator of acetoin/glycerol metabolism
MHGPPPPRSINLLRMDNRTVRDFRALQDEILIAAVEINRWNVRKAAAQLGMVRETLHRHLSRMGYRCAPRRWPKS